MLVDRDPVAAGDDGESHAVDLEVGPAATLGEVVDRVLGRSFLALIGGGHGATWVVQVGGRGGLPLAVVAQDAEGRHEVTAWLHDPTAVVGASVAAVFFAYRRQDDPAAVLAGLRR